MANTSKPESTFDAAQKAATKMTEEATKSFEQNAERVKEFNSSVADSSKSGVRAIVDSYETAAKNFFDMQRKLADANQVEWLKDTSKTQIQFAEEVTDAWVKAARNLSK